MHRLMGEDERRVFEAVADAAPAMLWMALPDGECVYLSPSWYAFTGLAAPGGLGQGWAGPIHPDDRSKVLEAYEAAARTGQKYQIEYRLRAFDNTFRWVLDSAAPFKRRFASQPFDGYVGSIVEIQERKQAELQRDLAAMRASLSIEASEIGLWEWDLQTNLFDFSPQARRIFGFPESSLPVTFGQMQDAIHPGDIEEVRRKSAQALDPDVRAVESYQYRIHRTDGSLRWIHARGKAIFEDDPVPRPVRYIGTFRDVTDAVWQENNLRQAAERLQMAMNAAGLAVWELDPSTGSVYPSPELNRLYGFPEDAAPTIQEFQSRYAPGELERVERLGREAEARGDTEIRVEVLHVWPNGEEKWLYIQARKAEGADGSPRVIGVAMDITERKNHERQLQVVARELQHRVKNSLSIVQTLASQTFRPGQDIKAARKVFEQRLHSLARTTDLLTHEMGTGAWLGELVEACLQTFRPEGATCFRVEGEPVTLPPKLTVAVGMALHELATNAIKYGALSVPSGIVHLSWRRLGTQLALTWRETGGPPVAQPSTTGFGTRLLGGALFTPQEGNISVDFAPAGVVCTMVLNMRDS